MAITKITEKTKVDVPQDDASLLITQKIDGQEKLRRTPLVAAVEKALPNTEPFTELKEDLNELGNRFDALGLYIDEDGDVCQKEVI